MVVHTSAFCLFIMLFPSFAHPFIHSLTMHLFTEYPLKALCVCTCVRVCSVTSVLSDSLQPYVCLYPTRLLSPWWFSRQEYWSGSPCPPPGDLPDPGIKPEFLTSPALASGFFTTSTTWEALGSEKSPVIGYATLKRMSKWDWGVKKGSQET